VSPAWIRTREVKIGKRNPAGGKRYQVLYRRGGRAYKIESGGTFRTLKDARVRRDVVAGWLAQGLNPKNELAKLGAAPPLKLTLREWAARYERSRVDYAAETAKNVRSHIRKIVASPVAEKSIDAVELPDLQELVADWSEDLKPSSISRYMATVRLIFDYAGVEPNPAREDKLKLPAIIRQEANPPDADQFLTMLRAMPRRYWLPLVVIEQTGMRVGEAASLEWGDVDEQGSRFRLRAGEVKTRRARWVQVPGWLMEVVAGSLAREDRTEQRKVFGGFTADVAKNAMARACRSAGLPHFSPHDLRHRRGTIWHHDPAVTIREQMDRGGWSRSDIAIDTYSHLLPLAEVPESSLRELLVMSR
jgi:integrase